MLARDVMTASVVTVRPDTDVRDIAALLLERRISAVPVTDDGGHVLGIVSEGDLINRPDGDTSHRGSWWLELVRGAESQALDYLKTHGRRAEDVMTREVISVSEDTPISEIASLLEKRHIKRVPVLREGRLAGIVSRADLLRGLSISDRGELTTPDDRQIRDAIHRGLSEAGLGGLLINVSVKGGAVELSGQVRSDVQRQAACAAAIATPGVRRVEDSLIITAAAVGAGGGYV